jgi:hypothetical protein
MSTEEPSFDCASASKITVIESPDLEMLGVTEEGVILYDGLEGAFLGIASRFGWSAPVAVYDYHKCIEIFQADGCSELEAVEHFEYNVIGGWIGKQTPIFLSGVTLPALQAHHELQHRQEEE